MRRDWLVLAFLLTFAPAAVAGTTIRYPRHAPAFTLEAATGWTAEETDADSRHPLAFRPTKGRADYSIRFYCLGAEDLADRPRVMRRFAEQQLQSAEMVGLSYEAPEEDKLRRSGLPIMGQVVRGEIGGVEHAYVFALFVVKDHAYMLVVNGPVTALDEGTRVADRIADTIRPVER